MPFSKRWPNRIGLTLVEVLAGLALMGTLLAALLLAFGVHVRQARLAEQHVLAAALADRLLTEWSTSGRFPPLDSSETVKEPEPFLWRFFDNTPEELRQNGLRRLRLEVVHAPVKPDEKEFAAVELLAPGTTSNAPNHQSP